MLSNTTLESEGTYPAAEVEELLDAQLFNLLEQIRMIRACQGLEVAHDLADDSTVRHHRQLTMRDPQSPECS